MGRCMEIYGDIGSREHLPLTLTLTLTLHLPLTLSLTLTPGARERGRAPRLTQPAHRAAARGRPGGGHGRPACRPPAAASAAVQGQAVLRRGGGRDAGARGRDNHDPNPNPNPNPDPDPDPNPDPDPDPNPIPIPISISDPNQVDAGIQPPGPDDVIDEMDDVDLSQYE